jgi:hypothetical protein
MKTLLALIGAALIAGCAGGGGSKDVTPMPMPIEGPPQIDWRAECADWGSAWYTCFLYMQKKQAWIDLDWQADKFKSWSTQTGVQTVRAEGVSTRYTATSGTVDTASESYLGLPYVEVQYSTSAGEPYELSLRDYRLWSEILETYPIVHIREGQGYEVRYPYFGRPGFVALTSTAATASAEKNPFVEGASGAMVLAASPNWLGWNYQSFGIWDVEINGNRYIDALTFGAPSLATAVPTAGNATFNGVLGGLYISPAGQGSLASANLRVDVDFGARTLDFASTATTLTRNLSTSTLTAAPNLDLSGTLRYDAGSASFSGTLVNAGGTLSGSSAGKFYGPTAQELGGAFQAHAASGVETFTGAYGAKR